MGKLNLVDLAGSERQNKTQAEVSVSICNSVLYYVAVAGKISQGRCRTVAAD